MTKSVTDQSVKVGPHCQICGGDFDSVPLYATPPAEADKLRSALTDLVSWFTQPVQGQNGMVWVIPSGGLGADDAVEAALAALKEEG